jgi:hypothetical protein
LSPALAWGRTIHHARIAFDGLGLNYPLTGSDNSNYADYLSTGGPQHQRQEITDCRTLRRELDAGRYTYVVFTGSYSTGSLGAVNIGNLGNLAQHDAWVRGAPQAVPVLTTPVATAYRLTGALDPAGCPS